MLEALALFDLDTLKTWCKVVTQDPPTAADSEALTVLTRIGNGASAYCEARIGQKFKQRTYAVVRDGDGRRTLLRLPRPIVSVASLTIDGVAIDASDFVIYADAGKVALKTRVFTTGVGNIAVTLDAGYADGALPADVVAAALDLAKSHYDEWNVGGITLSSISIGPASAIIRPGLNPRVEKFLDAHKDVRI